MTGRAANHDGMKCGRLPQSDDAQADNETSAQPQTQAMGAADVRTTQR